MNRTSLSLFSVVHLYPSTVPKQDINKFLQHYRNFYEKVMHQYELIDLPDEMQRQYNEMDDEYDTYFPWKNDLLTSAVQWFRHPSQTIYKYLYKVFDCQEEWGLGTLLTGDIPLGNTKEWDVFQKHFIWCLPKAFCVQIPHHGSQHNWNHGFIDAAPDCLNWVASSKKRSRYVHPHPEVVADIVAPQMRYFLWCHENQKVQIC
jgi:hypothetical protein